MKSNAQQLYEMELARRPTYPNGEPRSSWEELDAIARWSWKRGLSVSVLGRYIDARGLAYTMMIDNGWRYQEAVGNPRQIIQRLDWNDRIRELNRNQNGEAA